LPRKQKIEPPVDSYPLISNQALDDEIESQPDSLRLLIIDFGGCKEITDQGLDSLFAGLLRCVSLGYLWLSFSDCDKITDKGFVNLGEALQKLRVKHYVDLNFTRCGISEESANSLKESLKRCGVYPRLSS